MPNLRPESARGQGDPRKNGPGPVPGSGSRIDRDQRYSPANPCPICGGSEHDKRGQGSRCIGFRSSDGEYARCSREEHAGSAPLDPKTNCYRHKLKGECKCGRTHGPADVIPYPNRPARAPRPSKGPEVVQAYEYRDGTGMEVLFEAVRRDDKTFRQRRPDPDRPGGWINNITGVQTVLYRLQELVSADPSQDVWVVEGEKDVETLRKLGLLATTSPMGAGKWKPEYSHTLRGRNLILCGDNDKAGRDHMKTVAESSRELAASIRVVDLAKQMKALGLGQLPEKGDVSDFVAMGGTLAQLQTMAEKAPDPFKVDYATLADAVEVIGDIRWFWDRWIPAAGMSLLAAVGGGGKTRTAVDLARRLWLGLPFPDGSPNPFPPGTRTLWIMYDRNWAETADVLKSFGMPLEAIILAASKDNPLETPDFDDPRTMDDLKRLIDQEKPGLVVIDTITYATSRNTSKAEEAKAAFDGLIQIGAETGLAILALTHLNKEGEVLGRRITERARSVLLISLPDPEGQPNRRKILVDKTAVKKPPPLGITFTDTSNDYDGSPPDAPDLPGKQRGPAPAKSTRAAEWLWDQLSMGPMKVKALVDGAQSDGIIAKPTNEKPKPSISPLYNARDRIPSIKPGWTVEEMEVDGRKVWKLAAPADDPPPKGPEESQTIPGEVDDSVFDRPF